MARMTEKEAWALSDYVTKKETMSIRLAALSAIVRKMQATIKNDKELIGV